MLILTPSQQTDDQQQSTPISLIKENNNNNNDKSIPPPPRVISAEIKKPNGCILTTSTPVKQHVQCVQTSATKNGCVANKNNHKKNISSSLDYIQPKISGELFVQYEDDINKKPIWLRSHVNIYGGILFITNFIINKQRIPLRDFNLRPVTATSTSQDNDTSVTSNRYIFALFSRHSDQQPEVTFKTRTEHEYNIWVKIISIELLKQTSIYNIKYLDLMGLTFNINNHTTVPTTNNNNNITNNEQQQRTRRRSSSSSSDHSTTSSHTECSSRCSSLSSHHSSSNNSLTSRITNNYSCSKCNSLNRYNSNSTYSINDKKCSSCSRNTKVCNTRLTPTTVSRYNNSNNSTTTTANEKRRCFSELNLNLLKHEENNTKDNFNFNNNRILASTSSSSSSSDDDENHDTKTSCTECSNNYLSYTEYKKLLAKERIQRVLQPKIEKTIETNNNLTTTTPGIRSYTRVYNIREGVQLKSYDLPLKSTIDPIKTTHVKNNNGESKKLDMLRKNTNQLINNNNNNITSNVIEETVEQLLKKCQNSDNYVPVKDKLILFESLCKLGRKSLINNQNLIIGANNNYNNTLSIEKRRTQSMYDLNNNHVGGVRQICKYFETQSSTNTNHMLNNTNKFNTIAKGYRKVISVDVPAPLTPSIESKSLLMNSDHVMSQYNNGLLRGKINNNFNNKKNTQFIKSNTTYSLYNQNFNDDFNKNTKNYFGFKQFREGNKIISYV